MKVSLSWLKDYIDVDLPPARISDELTMAGLEVDSVEQRYDYLDNVVVARVEEVQPHPNADKLTVCKVNTGNDQLCQIVCGAPNVRQGMLVPCALPGAVLPGELKIKKGKLRGQVSEGMLCSAAELRLATDASGIMDMEGDFSVGMPLEQALSLSDTVFEVDLTPNRPDCLSVIGVAREVGAFTKPRQRVKLPDFNLPADRIGSTSIHDVATVEILDPDLCPRYAAGLLFDVKIGPSPFWLQEKLESVGMTPINNVVDVTNFVMMETGQPLHAFDFDEVAGSKIIVRRAGNDIDFKTLDSKDHKLEPDMLMICDGERPVALAGVMGGENSEISDKTERVLVESAYFNPVSIRRTAKITGIATDASHRFERGVDPQGTVNALNRAVALIAQICDATIARDIIDEHPQKSDPTVIDLSTSALNIRLGTDLNIDEIRQFLESVEFGATITGADTLQVTVPSFRVDVSRPEDLSEEVARLWGYNNIQTSYPLMPAQGRPLSPRISLRKKVRRIMTGFSFTEAINYNFINEDFCDQLNLNESDERRRVETILNPISEKMSVLRSTLIPGLLETMRKNVSQQEDTLRMFEIGKAFLATQKGSLPVENEMVAGLMTGNRTKQAWYAKRSAIDFYDLKGVVEGLLTALKIGAITFERIAAQAHPYLNRGVAALVLSDTTPIGVIGKVDAQVVKNFGLKQDAYLFEFDLSKIESLLPESISASPLPRFPAVSRDITIIVDRQMAAGRILDRLDQMVEKELLMESVGLFDVFEGEPVPAGKKSMSFRVVYRAENKTLKDKNVQKLHTAVSHMLLDEFSADLPE